MDLGSATTSVTINTREPLAHLLTPTKAECTLSFVLRYMNGWTSGERVLVVWWLGADSPREHATA